jgi:hypothetical protein
VRNISFVVIKKQSEIQADTVALYILQNQRAASEKIKVCAESQWGGGVADLRLQNPFQLFH